MAEDINQLLKVRREKLQNLQEAGKDPFKITKCDVTHHSMEIKNNYDELEGKTVTIAGRLSELWEKLLSVIQEICRGTFRLM